MKKVFISLVLISIFLSPFVFAQEPAKQEPSETTAPEEKFAAIVQYSKGKTTHDFKDLINYDKVIEVPKDSYIKVITQKRCIAVFYENTKVHSPADKVSPWKILSGTARWICPEDKIERVTYKDAEVQVQNGEFLQTGNQITAIRKNVSSEGKNLNLETVYMYKEGKWLSLKSQPDPYDLWKKQEKFPPPLESARLKMEKPQDPYVTRIFLTVAPVGFAGLYNHEWENHASDFNMEAHAFRLGTNFPWRNRSIFTFLEYSQGESRDRMDGMGPPPVGYKSLKFEATTLGLGLRHNHVKSSSFYYYLGLTHQKVFTHLRPTNFDYYDSKIVYPYNISIGGGYQKIFWAKSWISLVMGFDLKIIQSLSQGKVTFFNQPWNSNRDPQSAVTEWTGLFYLGPTFNF